LTSVGSIHLDLTGSQAPQNGNVTAEVIDGTLVERGGAAGNQVTIVSLGDGGFALWGANGQTTVNSQVAWPTCGSSYVVMAGATQGIDVDLVDGDTAEIDLYATHAPGDPIFFGAVEPDGQPVAVKINVWNRYGFVKVTAPAGYIGTVTVLVGIRRTDRTDSGKPWLDYQLVPLTFGGHEQSPPVSLPLAVPADAPRVADTLRLATPDGSPITDLNGKVITPIEVGQQFQLKLLLMISAPGGVQLLNI